MSDAPTLLRRYVKFQRVVKLSIFVESNQEDEETTVIQKLAIYGSSGDACLHCTSFLPV